jgi:hypothetical protein
VATRAEAEAPEGGVAVWGRASRSWASVANVGGGPMGERKQVRRKGSGPA